MAEYNCDTIIRSIDRIISSSGLKQGFVAEAAGFTEQQFSDMMNGRKIIRAEYIPEIAKALGVTPNEIFSYNR